MKIYIILCIFTLVQSAKKPRKICDMLSDDLSKQCYVKEILLSIPHSPNQMAVDKGSNSLYFSFDSGQGEYVPAILKIDTRKLTVLKGVKDAFAIASDPTTNEMYFGGSHGIYRYKPANKTLLRLAINNLDIWWLLIKRKIFFIKFPNLNAYYYVNRTIKYIPELINTSVHQLIFDNEDNIFFVNTTGLYGIKHDSDKIILLRDTPRFLGMAADNNGNVYVCNEDGIFVISRIVQKVRRVVNIQGVLGLTFDRNNNIVYTNSRDLVRLVPTSQDNYYKHG